MELRLDESTDVFESKPVSVHVGPYEGSLIIGDDSFYPLNSFEVFPNRNRVVLKINPGQSIFSQNVKMGLMCSYFCHFVPNCVYLNCSSVDFHQNFCSNPYYFPPFVRDTTGTNREENRRMLHFSFSQ